MEFVEHGMGPKSQLMLAILEYAYDNHTGTEGLDLAPVLDAHPGTDLPELRALAAYLHDQGDVELLAGTDAVRVVLQPAGQLTVEKVRRLRADRQRQDVVAQDAWLRWLEEAAESDDSTQRVPFRQSRFNEFWGRPILGGALERALSGLYDAGMIDATMTGSGAVANQRITDTGRDVLRVGGVAAWTERQARLGVLPAQRPHIGVAPPATISLDDPVLIGRVLEGLAGLVDQLGLPAAAQQEISDRITEARRDPTSAEGRRDLRRLADALADVAVGRTGTAMVDVAFLAAQALLGPAQ